MLYYAAVLSWTNIYTTHFVFEKKSDFSWMWLHNANPVLHLTVVCSTFCEVNATGISWVIFFFLILLTILLLIDIV